MSHLRTFFLRTVNFKYLRSVRLSSTTNDGGDGKVTTHLPNQTNSKTNDVKKSNFERVSGPIPHWQRSGVPDPIPEGYPLGRVISGAREGSGGYQRMSGPIPEIRPDDDLETCYMIGQWCSLIIKQSEADDFRRWIANRSSMDKNKKK